MEMRRVPVQPLILLENEDIKFVEDDFSSSSSEKNLVSREKIRELDVKTQEEKDSSDVTKQENDEVENGHYTEITVMPMESSTDVQKTKIKSMENLKPPPTSEPSSSRSSSIRSNKSINFVLNVLNRSPKTKKKARHEYEMVSTKDEESTYSNMSVMSTSKAEGGSKRKISGSNTEVRKNDPKTDEDEQILEALRHVVRKCTNPDPMKRPTSRDLFDIVDIAFDKS